MNTPIHNLLAKANAQIQARQYPAALESYRHICELDPGNHGAWLALGVLSGQLGDYIQARSAFQQAIALKPDSVQAQMYLGKTLEALDQPDAAEAQYRKTAEIDGMSTDALMNLGMLQGRRSRFREAAETLHAVLVRQPGNAMAHFCLAAAREGLGEHEAALAHYRSAVQLQPTLANAHNSMGVLLQKLGRIDEAITSYRKAIDANPAYATAHYNMGVALNECGDHKSACEHLRKAIHHKHDTPAVRNELGLGQRGIGNTAAAIESFNSALALDPNNVPALVNLAGTLLVEGRTNEATALYKKALELDPQSIDANCGLASVLEISGDFSGAWTQIEPLLASGNKTLSLALAFGNACRRRNRHDDAIRELEQMLAMENHSPGARSQLHHLLGKLHDDMKNYDAAFVHFQSANDSTPHRYDAAWHEKAAEALRETYTIESTARLPRATQLSGQAVFIVGMPRSGTTLIEQILASHPAVYGAGELNALSEIVDLLDRQHAESGGYPHCIRHVDVAELEALAQRYLLALRKHAPQGAQRITDKMPHNFNKLGLIEQLLPDARIIHCRRDPRDTCLSIYMHGFNAAHPYANDLTALGHYYRHYYEPIVAHWKQVCRLPILELHYEELIDDQEGMTRRLIEFCGLDWHQDCLQFHKTRRAVATPSNEQVRQPIYRDAMGRWLNYEPHLQPLLRALDLQEGHGG